MTLNRPSSDDLVMVLFFVIAWFILGRFASYNDVWVGTGIGSVSVMLVNAVVR